MALLELEKNFFFMQWLLRLSVRTIKFLAFKNFNCLKYEIELNLVLFPEWSKHLYKVLKPTTILTHNY